MSTMNEAGHLLCTIPLQEPKEVIDRIRKRFPQLKITYISTTLTVDWDKGRGLPEEIWKDVTVLCTIFEFPLDPSLALGLEFVHLITAGTNHIWNTSIYKDSQVPLTTSTGIHGPVIAEWVIMMSLVASRKYDTLRGWQRQHSWTARADLYKISDNVGKRFGILGYGSIGRQVGKLARGMGMDVVVFTASPRDTPESKMDHGYVVPGTGDPEGEVPSAWYSGHDKNSLHSFLGQDLDQLLVSVPLTEATKHLLGKKEFEILGKKNAFLINVARGEIIVQEDLIEALEQYESDVSVPSTKQRRGLRGAALDVVTPEPLEEDHPLWDAPNCIITPYISSVSRAYSHRAFEVLEVNLERRTKGLDLINVVNREVGYPLAA